MFSKIFLFLFILTLTYSFASTNSKGNHYVNVKALKVRVAPTTKSTHSYSIYRNYKVRVYQLKNGWARISRYKTTTSNGKFIKKARWVYAKFITPANAKKKRNKKKRNKTPKKVIVKTISPAEALVKVLTPSDNYAKYTETFQIASQKLIDAKRCRLQDFRKMRGWVESSPSNMYFTYCGGFKKTNKIYLDITTGEVTKPLRAIRYK